MRLRVPGVLGFYWGLTQMDIKAMMRIDPGGVSRHLAVVSIGPGEREAGGLTRSSPCLGAPSFFKYIYFLVRTVRHVGS